MSIQFEYFYGSQAEQFSFYRIPKVLFTDETLAGISVEAKVLYSFMLDRMSLSVKNCWFDEENRVYIIYTIDDILSDFGCARQKALKLLDELENGIELIERKRQGLGRPNIIYVKNFILNHSQVSRHKKAQFFRGSGYFVCSQYKASASLGVSILSVPCGLFVL